jgi:hypothetical protein
VRGCRCLEEVDDGDESDSSLPDLVSSGPESDDDLDTEELAEQERGRSVADAGGDASAPKAGAPAKE